MRVKFKPWAKDYISENPQMFVHSDKLEVLQERLKGYKTIKMEIGVGKGKFIHAHAKANPDTFFIGVELVESIIVQAADKLVAEPLDNLMLWATNVYDIKDIEFLAQKINTIYLNFSDPWPKTRHEKRRLTSVEFLNLYKNILASDGCIEQKTDNVSLFDYSVPMYLGNGFKFADFAVDLHKRDPEVKIITTEYEEKFLRKGQPIFFVKVEMN